MSVVFRFVPPLVLSERSAIAFVDKSPENVRVDCQGIGDSGIGSTEDVARFASYYAERAKEYDARVKVLGQEHVCINCYAGLHRSVSVAIIWGVWRGVFATAKEGGIHYLKVRGTYADGYNEYKMAIDAAVRGLCPLQPPT